jgi:hypothetical protein
MVINIAMLIGPVANIVYAAAASFFTGAFWAYATLAP